MTVGVRSDKWSHISDLIIHLDTYVLHEVVSRSQGIKHEVLQNKYNKIK